MSGFKWRVVSSDTGGSDSEVIVFVYLAGLTVDGCPGEGLS
jgi:hypothetical protein